MSLTLLFRISRFVRVIFLNNPQHYTSYIFVRLSRGRLVYSPAYHLQGTAASRSHGFTRLPKKTVLPSVLRLFGCWPGTRHWTLRFWYFSTSLGFRPSCTCLPQLLPTSPFVLSRGFALAASRAFYAVFASPSQDTLSGIWGGCSFTFHHVSLARLELLEGYPRNSYLA